MCHVLIIEDEWLIADYVEHLAREAGATTVDIVDCETDAVRSADGRCPEIILSDVNLRFGTGPIAVCTIQERWGPIPVIFITATPADCVPRHAQSVVLTKPLNANAFAEAFNRLVPS
ncbi:response regulator [Sphingomonas sp. PB2P12]|uniref:response regulator n=1 Tax=Sphingomonas sandaracina TaxID=3096157 RepID=UPI002FC59377